MEHKHAMLQRLADSMELPGEPMPGMSILELLGENRVIVEHHRGVIHYSPEKIIINVSYGQAELSGSSLELSRMTARQLVISGTIRSVCLTGKEKT